MKTWNFEGVEVKTRFQDGHHEVYWMSDWGRWVELQQKGYLASYDLNNGWNASVVYVPA